MSVVKINAIEVPEGAGEELERRFAQRAGTVQNSPGFQRFELLRPTGGESRYFVVTWWDSEESFEQWMNGGAASQAHSAEGGQAKPPVATGNQLLSFEVVETVLPES